MRRLSLLTVTLGSLFGLACMCGGGDDAYEDMDVSSGDLSGEEWQVTMAEPWASMGLPVGSGLVFASDPTMMLVSYDGYQVSSLASSYGSAIGAAGWSQAEDMSTPDFTAKVFTKGNDAVGLGVGAEEGMTFVYMEFMAGMGAGDTVDTTSSKLRSDGGQKPAFLQDGMPEAGKRITGRGSKVGAKRAKGSKVKAR